MKRSTDQIRRLLHRIRFQWRWDRLYTALYKDGAERQVSDPRQAPSEGLIGIYTGDVTLESLTEDLK